MNTTLAEDELPAVDETLGRAREWADIVVTMGCGEERPTSPATAKSIGTCPIPRASRSRRCELPGDEIERRVEVLVPELNAADV
jgi:hypothetical protein